MEEDQEIEHIKHVCKFCNKSFPCGRSLGGHMRSHHVTKFSAENEKMKKLSSEEKETTGFSEGGGGYYGLRENPKKTWKRLTNSSEEEEKETSLVVVLDKLCKECGRGFQSWKALFGHMKCHSDKEKVILNDSQSDDDDNEVNVPPNRKRRSKRKRTRYMKKTTTTTTTSVTSSVSFAVNSEIEYEYEYEQEQEEVAISLMMLSRDVSNWGGINSIGESSETNLVSKIEGKRVISYNSETEKLVKQSDKKTRAYGKDKKCEIDSESELVVSKSKKSKYFDSEKKSNSYEISKKSYKKGKFECTTCNKIFHSYQALGGHRASHKRNKGCCFASKIENSENNTEFEEESNELVKNNEYVEEEEEEEEEYGELESQSQRVMVEVEESLPEIRNFLDLNLPAASTDEENHGNHDAEIYKPWWLVESNHQQETFVGLLTN